MRKIAREAAQTTEIEQRYDEQAEEATTAPMMGTVFSFVRPSYEPIPLGSFNGRFLLNTQPARSPWPSLR